MSTTGADRPSDRPRFSVVVPAVNESEVIGDCLTSLAEQDFPGHYEVVVVDNNSADDTAAVARSHGATVVFEARPGVCWARQRGSEAARGEIVVSTDADTTFASGWLSSIERSFARDARIVAVAGPCRFVGGPRWGAVYTTLLFGIVHLLYRLTGRVLYTSATNVAFRRDHFPGYDTHLTQGGDELGLLRRLRPLGRVVFDASHPTLTSARRLNRGLAYNIVVTCLYYYLLGYALNRLLGRRVMGTAPEVRGARTRKRRVAWSAATGVVLVSFFLAGHLGFDLV